MYIDENMTVTNIANTGRHNMFAPIKASYIFGPHFVGQRYIDLTMAT
jgi:hypothetical protein